MVTRGGGWDNFEKYIKERVAKNSHMTEVERATSGGLGSKDKGPDPYDPYDRAHVAYDQQKKFAQQWWQARNEGCRASLMQGWWLNDAILDGTEIWNLYEQTVIKGQQPTALRDGELLKLRDKK